MDAISFVYWLQGALELGQRKELSEAQVKIIQDHLNLVLNKVTPSYSVPKMPTNIGTAFRLDNTLNTHTHGAVC